MDAHNTTKPLKDEDEQEEQLAPGVTLANRYLVDQVIGVGGMGSVYRARDLHFPSIVKLVAVKEMFNQTRESNLREVFVQNFEREANIIASLSHPSIPRVYDFFIQGIHAYLVMEFVHGKDLEAVLDDPDLVIPVDQVTTWAIEMCEVLRYLHTHQPEPIIFRDIKPSNIMINQFNHVVLVDFGIAKAFRLGQKGTMMGTEGYSPPEQYRGEGSPLVDIYALGATLHHLLTRCDPQQEPPFSFNERPIRQYNPAVPVLLESIINKALEYHPENRFQSAEEMRLALIEVTSKSTVRPSLPNVAPSITAQQGIKPLWKFECEDEIRGTPAYDDGLVYIGSLDNNLYAVDAATGKFIWKYPTGGSIVGRPVIKDYCLYLGSEDFNLHVIVARNGRPIWTYHTDGFVRSSPCVTDNYVFIGSDDGYLHAVYLSTGSRVWRFHVASPIRSTAAFQNSLVYFGSESGDFYCVDLFGQPKWHTRTKRGITSSPVFMGENILFGSMDGALYAYDGKNGWETWRYRLGRGTISTPWLEGNVIYTGAVDGLIYAIDGKTAREVWTFRTDHQVTGSPIVVDNYLYCGSVDGNLYCLDARTGRQVWKYATEKPITGTPLVVDDVIFIGSTDKRLYAFAVR